MLSPSQKVASRIKDGLKKFQPIVASAKSRDVNESDTVVMLTGIFSEILGFDQYSEITTELAIRGTFCDLAIKIDGKFCFIVEAKAIGIDLKDNHIKQAIDYAANKGIEWVILTNAVTWKVFKVIFEKPIEHIQILEIDFLSLNYKNSNDIESLFMIAKESISKSLLEEYFSQKQATGRFVLGNLLLTEGILSSIRKELRTIYPDVKITTEEISHVLKFEVLRREITEGEQCDEAVKKIARVQRKKEKAKIEKVETAPIEGGNEVSNS